MPQTGILFAALVFAFVVFIISKGQLDAYLACFFGPKPQSSANGAAAGNAIGQALGGMAGGAAPVIPAPPGQLTPLAPLPPLSPPVSGGLY